MISTLIIGFSIAMLLFLLASGLTLIFGFLGVINFAHGALFMLGAFITYQIIAITGNFWVALFVAPLALAGIGSLMEMGTLRPLYARDHVYQLLMTFGAILVIDEIVKFIWGLGYQNVVTPEILSGSIELFETNISIYRIFVILVGLVVMAGLYILIQRTRLGMVLRATNTNSDMVELMGIRVKQIRTFIFALGAGLAGLGGVIAAPLFPVQIGMGFSIILDSFMVVVIGGLGRIDGAIAAAILLGMIQAFGQQYFAGWIELGTSLFLVVVLVFRPQGLFALTQERTG